MRLSGSRRLLAAALISGFGVSAAPAFAQDDIVQKIHGVDGSIIEVETDGTYTNGRGVVYICSEDMSHQLVAPFEMSVVPNSDMPKARLGDIINAGLAQVESALSLMISNPSYKDAVASGKYTDSLRSLFARQGRKIEDANPDTFMVRLTVPDVLRLEGCGTVQTLQQFQRLYRHHLYMRNMPRA